MIAAAGVAWALRAGVGALVCSLLGAFVLGIRRFARPDELSAQADEIGDIDVGEVSER